MKTIQKIVLLFACVCVFNACDIDQLWDKDYLFKEEEPRDGLLIYNCSSYEKWHFFAFDGDSIIGSCDAYDSIAYEEWQNRTDWDLAFHRQNIKTNSGVSGCGIGGIMEYKQETFSFDAIIEAPEEGYQMDVSDSIIYDMSHMMDGQIGYVYTGLSQPVKNWAVLTDMMNGVWTYAQKAFIVRTAKGKYAKIFLKNFKSAIGASGTVTMEYVYQSDGTNNLRIE
ncbi:MAG: hypothetical protein EZS26_002860 [Candidatus Ordinivivax streblomastigis]|uniref:Uncharacterized protein n=1 Tax=Candidatus Ordinivivax streblomastigis TaxID=2540710 RepID=A0A5M8NX67_9BACT|nr:MAG: hypothetical protein EZS26_002860 [Candidatus Ordinivivax streblomastigis]